MALRTFISLLWLSGSSFQTALPRTFANRDTSAPYKPLKFRDDGTFQVAIFEDLHFGENAWSQWGPQQDINSVKVLNQILSSESPDLVVLNGDLITGNNAFKENATVYVDQIVKPLVDRGLTWASTYGNHDSDYNISREGILEREHQWPNARTRSMVPGKEAGVSNYYLPVYPSECADATAESCTPGLILWFFDSRGGNYYQERDADGNSVPQPDWVDESVVQWYKNTNNELGKNYSKTIPSIAFVHIPMKASKDLQTEVGIDPNHEPGINDDYVLASQADGWCANGTVGCDYGGQDVPFMEALTSTKGLMAVFSGHDHGDTWCFKWNDTLSGTSVSGHGLNLCFGQHSGYGGYGTWIRGSRQVVISQQQLADLALDTYIRTEDAAVIGSITLNSTYGTDSYAASPDDHTDCSTCDYS